MLLKFTVKGAQPFLVEGIKLALAFVVISNVITLSVLSVILMMFIFEDNLLPLLSFLYNWELGTEEFVNNLLFGN